MKSEAIVQRQYPDAVVNQVGERFEVWSSPSFPRTLLGLSAYSAQDAWHDAANVTRLMSGGELND